MTQEEIKQYILSKKRKIDSKTLEYYTNYFYVLSNHPEIIRDNSIFKLINNGLVFAKRLVFYDEKDPIYKELGPDCKGKRDESTKTIYVRKDLEEPLKEMTIYHELHHAVQTNPQNDQVGINQESNFGRMIMEAQTQYFAEKVYEEIHGVKFEEREIPSEELRMKRGGTVVSALHNYEMYDSVLSKLSIILEVPKDYFVGINYMYKDDEGMNKLRRLYETKREKYRFPYKFEDFMYGIDYIYCADVTSYTNNPAKETILSGKQTEERYGIHTNRGEKLSQDQQFAFMTDIDRNYLLSLIDHNGNFQDYSKYVLDNGIRMQISQVLDTIEPEINQSMETK